MRAGGRSLIFLSCDHNEYGAMRVLMVEDDVKMAGLVRRGLEEDGHAADVASSGEDAVWMAQAHPYDAIVLDVMLPGLDGFETCKRLRNAGVWSPVLMLTARDAVERPRRRARRGRRRLPDEAVLLRRAARAPPCARPSRRLERPSRARRRRPAPRPGLAAASGAATPRSQLSPKEFALLETFMRRPGQVLSRLQLLEHAWDFAYENRSNVVDVYVRYLREKLDRPFGKRSFETVRGVGLPAAGGGVVSRLPIRVRLALVLRAGDGRRARRGGVVRLRARELRPRQCPRPGSPARGQDLSALVASGGSVASTQGALIENGESFSEVVGSEGSVLDATPPIGRSAALVCRASRGAGRADLRRPASVPGLDEPARIFACPRPGRQRSCSWSARPGEPSRDAQQPSRGVPHRRADRPPARCARRLSPRRRGAPADRVDAAPRGRISATSLDERLPVPPADDEVSRLGETLNAMLARLEDGLERERRFVADASHELRTPLAL